jgi:hypothetical protein
MTADSASLNLASIDIGALPTVLLLGFPASGKTQAISAWSLRYHLFEVKRGDDGKLSGDAVVRHARVNFRNDEVTEYVVVIGGDRFRLFDLPGEVLRQALQNAPDQATAATRYLDRLLRLRPRVAGVVVCAVPPSGDRPGQIQDVEQLKADKAEELGEQQATTRLAGALDMVEGLVWEKLRDQRTPGLAVTVQIGFADLVRWQGNDLARLASLYRGLRPGSSSRLGWFARRRRTRALREVDAIARANFGWLARAGDPPEGAERIHLPVTHVAPERFRELPNEHTGIGLLGTIDRIVAVRRRRRLRRVAVTTTVAAAVIGMAGATGLHAWAARVAPEWLPAPLAVRACLDAKRSARRCACLSILARANAGDTLRARLDLMAPFVAECRLPPPSAGPTLAAAAANVSKAGEALKPRDTELLTLMAHFHLARAAMAPGQFAPATYKELTAAGASPGKFGGPSIWYPATTAGQAGALRAIVTLAELGQAPDAVALAAELAPQEREEFSDLLKLAAGAAATRACLDEWARARESGAWKLARSRCGDGGERMPAEWRACFRAEAATGFAGLPAQVLDASCIRDSGCSGGTGLETLMFRVPKPDAATFANLAAGATKQVELDRCIGHTRGAADRTQVLLLRLLGPGPFQDRLAAARSVSDEHGRAVNDFLGKPWVVAESGKRLNQPRGRELLQRVPMLPLSNAVEAACALVDVATLYNPPASPIPWREPLDTGRLDDEVPATLKARTALSLLVHGEAARSVQGAGCEITALATLLRLPRSNASSAWLARLDAALRVVEGERDAPEAAITAQAATQLRCRLGVDLAHVAAGMPQFSAVLRCPAPPPEVVDTPAGNAR